MSTEFNDDYINKNINGKITPSLSDIIYLLNYHL